MDDRFDGRLVALDRLVLEQWAQAKLDEAHALLALLDRADADPEIEDNGDDELTGDEKGDQSWTEASSLRGKQLIAGHEDAEEDDPPEEDDPSGQSDEDGVNTGTGRFGLGGPSGAGCPISDDDCEHDWREEEAGV